MARAAIALAAAAAGVLCSGVAAQISCADTRAMPESLLGTGTVSECSEETAWLRARGLQASKRRPLTLRPGKRPHTDTPLAPPHPTNPQT
jgi:hypothetical protein